MSSTVEAAQRHPFIELTARYRAVFDAAFAAGDMAAAPTERADRFQRLQVVLRELAADRSDEELVGGGDDDRTQVWVRDRVELLAEPGGGTVAQLRAMMKDRDDGLAGKGRNPFGDIFMGAPDGGGDETRVGGKIFVIADVDDDRRGSRADEAAKLFRCNGVWS